MVGLEGLIGKRRDSLSCVKLKSDWFDLMEIAYEAAVQGHAKGLIIHLGGLLKLGNSTLRLEDVSPHAVEKRAELFEVWRTTILPYLKKYQGLEVKAYMLKVRAANLHHGVATYLRESYTAVQEDNLDQNEIYLPEKLRKSKPESFFYL